MRFLLTVDGVPAGSLALRPQRRAAGYLTPWPAFVSTGLSQVAARFTYALTLSYGPRARPNPRQRRLLRAARAEQREWGVRLGLLDEHHVPVPAAPIRVFWNRSQAPLVVVGFDKALAADLARLTAPRLVAVAAAPPAA